ncbi:MAG: hypothetical protein EBU54_10220 [Mycobacteriaceae bacterium]|nr:hypothetical protein [Mycobacteriaceae bacterium]
MKLCGSWVVGLFGTVPMLSFPVEGPWLTNAYFRHDVVCSPAQEVSPNRALVACPRERWS